MKARALMYRICEWGNLGWDDGQRTTSRSEAEALSVLKTARSALSVQAFMRSRGVTPHKLAYLLAECRRVPRSRSCPSPTPRRHGARCETNPASIAPVLGFDVVALSSRSASVIADFNPKVMQGRSGPHASPSAARAGRTQRLPMRLGHQAHALLPPHAAVTFLDSTHERPSPMALPRNDGTAVRFPCTRSSSVSSKAARGFRRRASCLCGFSRMSQRAQVEATTPPRPTAIDDKLQAA